MSWPVSVCRDIPPGTLPVSYPTTGYLSTGAREFIRLASKFGGKQFSRIRSEPDSLSFNHKGPAKAAISGVLLRGLCFFCWSSCYWSMLFFVCKLFSFMMVLIATKKECIIGLAKEKERT